MNRDEFQTSVYVQLYDVFDGVYPNPQNAVIVPIGPTLVVVDSEQLDDGRLAVQIRASILRDLELTDELINYVALHCNTFKFGNLYLFEVESGKYDLDYANKVMSTWLEPRDLVELVAVAGTNAENTAEELHERFGGHQLNPSRQVWHPTHIGPEAQGRQDVWDRLNAALETQSCIVMGTAEQIELGRVGALIEGYFVVNSSYIWLAGRDPRSRAVIVWRIAHRDIRVDQPVRTDRHGGATYTALLGNGDALTVTTCTSDAAVAIRDAHHDPRDLNTRFAA